MAYAFVLVLAALALGLMAIRLAAGFAAWALLTTKKFFKKEEPAGTTTEEAP